MTTDPLDMPLRVSEHVHSRLFDNELVLLDLQGGNYYGLDAIGARVWDALKRGERICEIVPGLMEEYAVGREVLERDLSALAAEMLAKGLVECSAP